MAVPNIFAPNTKILSALVNANFAYIEAEIAATNVVVAGKLTAANNLSDLANAAAARTNLGLGSAALASIGTSGATLGLLSANKTDSGNNVFSGTNMFVTQALGDASTKAATTLFVATAIAAIAPLPLYDYIAGLMLSTAGASASFSANPGSATDSTNVVLMTLAGAINKTTAAWAVGTGNGSLDTGSIANTTWYHVFLIRRPDTGVVDVLTSLSPTAPTLPANYTTFRRIGSMKTDGSVHWVVFSQNGNEFLLGAAVLDVNTTATSVAALLTLASVPSGVKVNALIDAVSSGGAGGGTVIFTYINAPDQQSPAASVTTATNIMQSGTNAGPAALSVRTNTSGQIRAIASASSTLTVLTNGWIDQRGQNS